MSEFKLNSIGVIHSSFKQKYGTPRQSGLVPDSLATIEVEAKYIPEKSLIGLEGFSHIWILFLFHENSNKTFHPSVFPPRLKGKKIGVFASRSPHRPNSIGLSLVKLIKVNKNKIMVSGVDFIDGTPLIDIKPYLGKTESPKNIKTGWLENLSEQKLKVGFKKEVFQNVAKEDQNRLKKMIKKIIMEDPRSPADLTQKNHDKTYKFYLEDYDVHFKCVGNDAEVVSIKTL